MTTTIHTRFTINTAPPLKTRDRKGIRTITKEIAMFAKEKGVRARVTKGLIRPFDREEYINLLFDLLNKTFNKEINEDSRRLFMGHVYNMHRMLRMRRSKRWAEKPIDVSFFVIQLLKQAAAGEYVSTRSNADRRYLAKARNAAQYHMKREDRFRKAGMVSA